MNIEERLTDARRGEILRLLDQGIELDRSVRLFLSEKYGCAEGVIRHEIKLLRSLRVLAELPRR
jgi:hypothetical protein